MTKTTITKRVLLSTIILSGLVSAYSFASDQSLKQFDSKGFNQHVQKSIQNSTIELPESIDLSILSSNQVNDLKLLLKENDQKITKLNSLLNLQKKQDYEQLLKDYKNWLAQKKKYIESIVPKNQLKQFNEFMDKGEKLINKDSQLQQSTKVGKSNQNLKNSSKAPR